MSQNYSKLNLSITPTPLKSKYGKGLSSLAALILVIVSFYTSQLIVIGILNLANLVMPQQNINKSTLNFIAVALVYLVTLLLLFLMSRFIMKHKINRKELGLFDLPLWRDIFIAPAAFVFYVVLSSSLILLAKNILPWFDADQVQTTGFENLNQQYQYILAFIALVVVAPIAEELMFRGYMYGKLRKNIPVWAAILATSLSFGLIHGAWNIALDTFALSVVLCLLREFTGSLWPSILLHMMKNGLAFYILFISPQLLNTLGG